MCAGACTSGTFACADTSEGIKFREMILPEGHVSLFFQTRRSRSIRPNSVSILPHFLSTLFEECALNSFLLLTPFYLSKLHFSASLCNFSMCQTRTPCYISDLFCPAEPKIKTPQPEPSNPPKPPFEHGQWPQGHTTEAENSINNSTRRLQEREERMKILAGEGKHEILGGPAGGRRSGGRSSWRRVLGWVVLGGSVLCSSVGRERGLGNPNCQNTEVGPKH